MSRRNKQTRTRGKRTGEEEEEKSEQEEAGAFSSSCAASGAVRHVAQSDVGHRRAASMVANFGGVGMADTPRALRDRFCQTWRATQRAVDVEEVVLLGAALCREVLVPDQWQSAIQRFSQFSSAVGCSCIARARRLRLPCVARKTGSRPTKPPVGAPWVLRGSFAAPVGEPGHSYRFLGI